MWTPRHHLGELERLFVEMERRFDFLEEIDEQIVRSKEDFRAKLEHITKRFALQLIGADAVAICFPMAVGYLVNLLDDTTDSSRQLIPIIEQIIPKDLRAGKVSFKKFPRELDRTRRLCFFLSEISIKEYSALSSP